MEFGFTAQQTELRDVARRFLAQRYPAHRVAELADSAIGYAEDGWDSIVAMGWLDPELGMVDRALLAEEAGYALHPVPWWPSLFLTMPGVVTTTARTAFAWYGNDEDDNDEASACEAVPAPEGGWRVTLGRRLIPDLASATAVVLAARVSDGVALLRVRVGDPAVTVTSRSSLDGLRRMADLRCANAPAELIAPLPGTPELVQRMRWRALALLAAEGVGVGRRAYDFAVEHAKTRTQFDRPIGAYQGIGFRIADTYVAVELARSLAYRAAWLTEHAADNDAVANAVSCALVAVRDAATGACESAIQVLGGMGMTWEHPVHRWYRRALWLEAFDLGSAPYRERLAQALLGS